MKAGIWPVMSSVMLLLRLGPVLTAPSGEVVTSGHPSTSSQWTGFRSAVSQQSLQTVLVSIEERLRGLDSMFSPRYTPRWEVTIEQQGRRLETIESRLGRLETLLELRLDKLAETLSAKQLKEELSKDQLSRKVDSTYERLNHRLGYMEARLDIGISKIQSSVDAGTVRVERLEATSGGRQGEVEAELLHVGGGIEDLKKQLRHFEERFNNSTVQTPKSMGDGSLKLHVDRLTVSVENMRGQLNRSLQQNDGEAGSQAMERRDEVVDQVLSGVEKHAGNFVTKVSNMYNDLWRRTQSLEAVVKDSMSLSNVTRREVQEGFRSLVLHVCKRGHHQERDREDSSLEVSLDAMASVLQRRLSDLGRKIDSSFQMLMLAQNLFLESCHRIQQDETQLETKLTQVLEGILDTINSRSGATERELEALHELLKANKAQVLRALTQAGGRTVEEAGKGRRQLETAVAGLSERVAEGNSLVEKVVLGVAEDRTNTADTLDNIVGSLQELQELMVDLGSKRVGKEQAKKPTTPCLDSERLSEEIASFLLLHEPNKTAAIVSTLVTVLDGRSKAVPDEESVPCRERNGTREKARPQDDSEHEEMEENDEDFEEEDLQEENQRNATDDGGPSRFGIEADGVRTEAVEHAAQVTIKVIPMNGTLNLGHIAAIIQESDSGKQKPQTVTIIHEDLSIAGQKMAVGVGSIASTGVDYEDAFNSNETYDSWEATRENYTEIPGTPPELELSQSLNVTISNTSTVKANREKISSIAGDPIPTVALHFGNVTLSFDSDVNDETESLPEHGFTLSDTRISSSSPTTNQSESKHIIDGTKNNATPPHSAVNNSGDIHISDFFQKLIELSNEDEKLNSILENFWKSSIEVSSVASPISGGVMDENEGHEETLEEREVPQHQLNDTEAARYDTQRRKYLNKLGELAAELAQGNRHGEKTPTTPRHTPDGVMIRNVSLQDNPLLQIPSAES